MQVPERLALIGGSILLSSLLIFTLKSQASQILPKIEHPISSIYDHAGDAQKASEFDDNFQQAQQKGWQTGNWGSAKYYIDDQMNMHVGSGQLQDDISNILGINTSEKLKTLNFDSNVQAPKNSAWLLAVSPHIHNNTLQAINGLANMDTSQVTSMHSMFESEASPTTFDVSNWDTSHVQDMSNLFSTVNYLRDVNLSHWNTDNVTQTNAMFWDDYSLQDLNLSNFNLTNAQVSDGMNDMLYGSKVDRLSLGNNTRLASNVGFPNYTLGNGNQSLNSSQITDGNPHPGTWVKQ